MGDNKEKPEYLEISCQNIEFSAELGEIVEDSFAIHAADKYTEGKIYSSDTRMRVHENTFSGEETQVSYCFDGTSVEAGSSIRGEFVLISNRGEYVIPYHVSVQKPRMQSSLGTIKNLFHFTNLAQTNWEEAVALFYARNFASILHRSDKNAVMSYTGLTRNEGNEQNVEEFLIEISKKTPIIYTFDIEGFLLEDVQDSIVKSIVIQKSSWGYGCVQVWIKGDFISTARQQLTNADFVENQCVFDIYIDASKLHEGVNSGAVIFSDACNEYTIPVDILMEEEQEQRTENRRQRRAVCDMIRSYVDMRMEKITLAQWLHRFEKALEILLEMDEDSILYNLYRVQLLIAKERFNEAKWYLDLLEQRLSKEPSDIFQNCYYLYLTTLINCAEDYVKNISDEIETIYVNNPSEWRLGWFVLQLNEELFRNKEQRWQFMEEMFENGCTSPLLLCEAVMLLLERPTFLLKLDKFEESVLWHGARQQILKPELIEQLQYLAARKKEYSALLVRILGKVYEAYGSPQTVASVCHILILGGKKGAACYPWYALGVEHSVRVTGLYEYYMMSLELDKYGDIKGSIEIPKMVLMYFAFDSSLDSLHNAWLYAYMYRNRGQFPDLYENYREQIERFVVFQILKGRSNKYLAYLYKNLINLNMLTEETARGLSTVLFIQCLTVKRSDIRRAVLIYEKEKYEAVYPVAGREAYLPVYGGDCRLILEDGAGNRYCREEEYTLERLLVPDQLAAMIAPYVDGSVHFDLWLCERGNNLSSVTADNVVYMKRLADSDELLDEVCREIRMKLIDFYYDTDRIQDLDDFLEKLSPEQIDNRCFAKVTRFIVLRGMHEKAFEWIKLRGAEGVDAKTLMRLCSRLITIEGMEEDPVMTILIFRAFKAGKYDENLLEYLCRFFVGTSKEMRDVWKAAESFGVDTYMLSERLLIQMMYTGAFLGERVEIFKRYVSGGARSRVELAVLAWCAYDYFARGRQLDDFILEDLLRAAERQEEIPFVCKLACVKYYAENKKKVDERVSLYLIVFLREMLAENIYFSFFREYADNIAFMRQFLDKTMIEYRVREGNKAYIHYLLEKEGGNGEEYIKEEMRDMFGGICVKQFILFFGEHLQYYITEVEDGKEHLTESGTLSHNDAGGEEREDRYTLLNDISIGRNLHDHDTMESLLREYFEKDFIVRELFRAI